MCKVYNSIGCLTAIKDHLQERNVNDFNSVKELLNFQKNYSLSQQQIHTRHLFLVEKEKDALSVEIAMLNDSIRTRKSEVDQEVQLRGDKLRQILDRIPSANSNIVQSFCNYLKKHIISRKFALANRKLVQRFGVEVNQSNKVLAEKENRYQYLISHFQEAVKESSFSEMRELERKKEVIDEVHTSIYGAIGEQKLVKELESLSDEYILINDFSCSFYPPIYWRQEDDYIKSIQVDHLLLSPSGIFLIETKNWSEQSINNLSLRSPVKQIRRASFALYKMLAEKVANRDLILSRHHWGDRSITIKNLIVLINQKPVEEFQYVKVLCLKELLGYIKYFKPVFSNDETQMIANYLLELSGSKCKIRGENRAHWR